MSTDTTIKIPNRKIEDRAIAALREIINAHPTMEEHINHCDKEMSWDGYLTIYNDGESGSDKKRFEAKIPVQIKGHTDKYYKFLNKDRVKYLVSVDDLTVYFKECGCLYFQIFISEDGKERQVFYNSLYLSKIKSYLNGIQNKKSITLSFIRLIPDANELARVCKQFSIEKNKQGFGRGPIVSRTINLDSLKLVNKLHFTTVGAQSPQDILKLIPTGDVVAYGSYDNDDIQYPIEWGDRFAVSMVKKIKESISVSDRVFYEEYRVESCATAPGADNYSRDVIQKIYLSPNLCFEVRKNNYSFQFNAKTDIMQMSKDADFIVNVLNSKGFRKGNQNIDFMGFNIEQELKSRLEGLIEVNNALVDIGFKESIPFVLLNKEDARQLDLLVQIKKGKKVFQTDQRYFWYEWGFKHKIFPFIVDKRSGEIKLVEFMFNRSLQLSLGCPAEDGEEKAQILPDDSSIVPNFIQLSADQLSRLCFYDYESMFDQVDSAVINDITEDPLHELSLALIGAYDINGDGRLLGISNVLLKRLEEYDPEALNIQINLLQIEKRRNGCLKDDSKRKIQNVRQKACSQMKISEDMRSIVEFCANVLLDNYDDAQKIYNKLSVDGRRGVDEYPIMNLYKSLKKKR